MGQVAGNEHNIFFGCITSLFYSSLVDLCTGRLQISLCHKFEMQMIMLRFTFFLQCTLLRHDKEPNLVGLTIFVQFISINLRIVYVCVQKWLHTKYFANRMTLLVNLIHPILVCHLF